MTLVLTILAICAVISALRCQRETECSNALEGWARNRALVGGGHWSLLGTDREYEDSIDQEPRPREAETLEIAQV